MTPRLLPENTYLADQALRSALARRVERGALQSFEPQLEAMGRLAGEELLTLADEAERRPPELRSVDAWGERVDEVVYGDAWRRIGDVAAQAGLVGLPYEHPGPAGRVAQAALCYLFAPSSATYSCPVAMTDAAARVLIDYGADDLREQVVPHLVAQDTASAWTAGQWMTEQQGGSDVGANSVEARFEDGAWRLYGRKYFCSNVGGEVVLALARPEGAAAGTRGLGLFLVPRLLSDGSRNAYRIDRLKDKLGTRAMATGEVTLHGARAYPVGDLEHGFQQMTPMLNITRFHNAVASAATIRRGLMLARCYACDRSAFGRRLDQLPLHRQVLLELAVKAEGCLALVMRVAELLGAVEAGTATVEEKLLFRVAASLAKLYTGKKAVEAASETIECFGGAGYMEDTGLARLLRDAQVLPIWEGTTSVLSLDVIRVLSKPGAWDAFEAELSSLGRRPAVPSEVSQQGARRFAFLLASEWIHALLQQAAGQGEREQAVFELWASECDPQWSRENAFDLVVGPA